MLRKRCFFFLLLLLLNDTFCFAQQIGIIRNKSLVVSTDVDLHGSVVNLPKGFTLEIKGGKIKNGTLVGDQTKVLCSGKVFDHVHISGTWNVPEISTSMFVDLSYDNALKDVLALAHPKVQNTILIEKGDYQVKAHKDADVCLTVPSNSTLIIQGSIRLQPNVFPRCDMVRATGNNIKISGNGSIIGDKHTHLGHEGEWGMGIRFRGAINATVTGLTIKDCWGDCVYVGGNSKNVLIENCVLDHGRRQGISVTKADGVTIRDCKISNVSGTKPQYAIDLEPNANDTVDHVLIEKVEVVNCEGGLLATKAKRNTETKKIGDVQIRNCKVSALSNYPISMKSCESLTIENCIINAKNDNSAIYTKNTRFVVVRNNTINVNKEILLSVKNTAKELVGKKGFVPICVIQAEKQEVRNNNIVEK